MRKRSPMRPDKPRNPELPFAKAIMAWSRRHGISQTAIANELGLKHRAVNRWMLGRAMPRADAMTRLLALAARTDIADAHALAKAGGAEPLMQAFEAAKATQSAPPPPPPQLSPRSLANAVVCDAADALGVPTRQVRPAILAAFLEARRIGATFDAIIAGLEEVSGVSRSIDGA
jgi:transcriptional regulator with XRE-family HTH domain